MTVTLRGTFPYLASALLHGVLLASIWSMAAPPGGHTAEMELVEFEASVTPPVPQTRVTSPRRTKPREQDRNAESPQASESKQIASAHFDLSSSSGHPYLQKLWRHLATAQQGLDVHTGSYVVRLKITKQGLIDSIEVSGAIERERAAIESRLRQVAFLPPVPNEMSENGISVHYRLESISAQSQQ